MVVRVSALKKGSRSDTLILSLPLASIGCGQFSVQSFFGFVQSFLGFGMIFWAGLPGRWVRLSGI